MSARWTDTPINTPEYAAEVVAAMEAFVAHIPPSDERPDFYEGPATDLGDPDGWQIADRAWEAELDRRWP